MEKIKDIDAAMEKFGMPVGPITLLDEVGIDVGEHIIKVLMEPFSDRLFVPKEIASVSKEGRKGRKTAMDFIPTRMVKKINQMKLSIRILV